MKIFKLIAVTGVLTFLSASAEDNWKVSSGISYRSFGNVELKNKSYGNSSIGEFIDGTITPIDNSSQVIVSIDSAIEQSLAGSSNTYLFNTVEGGGSSKEFESSNSLVFKAEKPFWRNVNWSVSFDIALSGLNSHDSYYSEGSTTTTAIEFSSLLQDGDNIDIINGQYALESGEAFSSVHDIRFNMISLSLGGSLKYDLKSFFISLGAGPSLLYLDSEISQTISLSSGESLTESGHFSDFKAGLYVDCSLGYTLSKRWGIGLNYRYDWVPEELANDLVEVELSGQSVGAFISYQF